MESHTAHEEWLIIAKDERSLTETRDAGYKLGNRVWEERDYYKLSGSLVSDLYGVPFALSPRIMRISSKTEGTIDQSAISDSVKGEDKSANLDSSNGRVMLIDGTSVIYRAYYKLLVRPSEITDDYFQLVRNKKATVVECVPRDNNHIFLNLPLWRHEEDLAISLLEEFAGMLGGKA
ncbi:hypothetical protein U1Q18_024948 [Sarracenia purpurea var. burkii]